MRGGGADGEGHGLSRRELLAGAAAGIALTAGAAAPGAARADGLRVVRRVAFAGRPDGRGWGGGWRTAGVANLRRAGGEGLLEAGSDVFPNDPRPVAFAVDCRLLDAEIAATITRIGMAPGVVLRRRRRSYYAAVYDTERAALVLMARVGAALYELGAVAVPDAEPPIVLVLAVSGTRPSSLRATLVDAAGRSVETTATNWIPRLQYVGDPGVLATANTLFPSERNPVLPALGNVHLLPWAVQEGQAFMNTAVGQEVIDEIRRRSTAGFAEIVVQARNRPLRSRPAILAATTGAPVPGGARLQVATDVAAHVQAELSYSWRFKPSWTVPLSPQRFHGASGIARRLEAGRRVYWRPRATRYAQRTTGQVRSFRVPPAADDPATFRIAVAACGSQFGPLFGELAARRPDVLVWQGDLNYPDTHGPLAQTMSGYAGIWRDFLANPVLAPILREAAFAPQRDDHDYGVQDANSTLTDDYPWALAPWDALMTPRSHYRFPAGPAEVWVLDQRRFKSDPTAPDTADKTLLGARQRRWLLRTLAASPAAFKIICSPCTVFMPANARDGNWAAGFEAERELVLRHVRERVSGTTLFLTGDTHLTGVYEGDGGFEARAAPVGIPKPNDITLVDPLAAQKLRGRPGVAYAGDENHFTLLEVRGGGAPSLDLTLVREDGATPYRRRFVRS